MRFRGKSIRRKIVALLLVPLLSLTAIWGFATVVTGRDVAQLFAVTPSGVPEPCSMTDCSAERSGAVPALSQNRS